MLPLERGRSDRAAVVCSQARFSGNPFLRKITHESLIRSFLLSCLSVRPGLRLAVRRRRRCSHTSHTSRLSSLRPQLPFRLELADLQNRGRPVLRFQQSYSSGADHKRFPAPSQRVCATSRAWPLEQTSRRQGKRPSINIKRPQQA